MLFKRRDKEPFFRRMGQMIWPRAGWSRASQYVGHRLGRMGASPYSIAAGVATGVAVSFTPFLGLHILAAAIFCLVVRAHVLSSTIGTLIGNPWTFPLMFALTGNVGAAILGEPLGDLVPSWDWNALWDNPGSYLLTLLGTLKPFIVGGLPVAAVAWLITYSLVKRGLVRYRLRRLRRINAKKGSRLRNGLAQVKEKVQTVKEKAQSVKDAHMEKRAIKAQSTTSGDGTAPAE